MINIKLLSTSIMIVFGVDGHGQCLTQSIIANKVLLKMGYKSKLVAGYHAKVISSYDEDTVVLHAPPSLIKFDMGDLNHSVLLDYSKGWAHCWVEAGNKIYDVNLHSISHKKYTDINNWDRKKLFKGTQYYMPTTYELDVEPVEDRRIQKVINIYNEIKSELKYANSINSMVEEGEIIIRKDGSWLPVQNYTLNENILPNTKSFVKNPNLLQDIKELTLTN